MCRRKQPHSVAPKTHTNQLKSNTNQALIRKIIITQQLFVNLLMVPANDYTLNVVNFHRFTSHGDRQRERFARDRWRWQEHLQTRSMNGYGPLNRHISRSARIPTTQQLSIPTHLTSALWGEWSGAGSGLGKGVGSAVRTGAGTQAGSGAESRVGLGAGSGARKGYSFSGRTGRIRVRKRWRVNGRMDLGPDRGKIRGV